MKGSGGNNDPKKLKNSLIESFRQTMNSSSNQDNSSKSLDKLNQQNQVGNRLNQNQSRPPPRPNVQAPKTDDGPSIFDKWVEFRDKYLTGNVEGGIRKVNYTSKFLFKTVVNSGLVNNLKDKAISEAYGLKDSIKNAQLNFSKKGEDGKGGWKENIKGAVSEKMGQGKEVLSEKLGQGKEILKDKAGVAFESGKEVLKDTYSQGKEIAKEKAGVAYESGKEILKEKLAQGKDVAKDALGQGKDAAKEKLGQGADYLKDKIGQGGQALKDKASEKAGAIKETVGKAPEVIVNKAYKAGRRVAMIGFVGLTIVAFAYAAGTKAPQAYFEYQFKKHRLESQNRATTAEVEVKQQQ